MANTSELACVYGALILHDDEVPVTAEQLSKVISAANVTIEPFWPSLFAKALEGHDISSLISNVGSAPAAAPAGAAAGGAATEAAAETKKEEEKPKSESESDDDMGFGLFD